MNLRRNTQTGQALVMVTLALMAMCGMMGLAVDLGWSFFVKKQAQAVADAAAMAAVYEAKARLKGNFTFACGGFQNNTKPYCAAAPLDCSTFAGNPNGPSNLNNGCLYARRNGFVSGSNGQTVTIQAADKNTLPTTPAGASLGITNIVYWVTVRTTQTVPQLFSAVLGNTTGRISAIATAAIVSEAVASQFVGLNRAGDCMHDGFDCGVNLDTDSGAINIPGSVALSSSCTSGPVVTRWVPCSEPAGNTSGPATITASSFTVQPTTNSVLGQCPANNVGPCNDLTPVPAASFQSTGGGPATIQTGTGPTFQDPTQGSAQPPLMASAPVPTCGIPGGVINSPATAIGPFNYYACSGTPCVANGQQITLQGNVTFSSNSHACPGNLNTNFGAVQFQASSFPSYLFYGGLNLNAGANGQINMGPGQYVLVGAPGSATTSGSVLQGSVSNVIGDTATGTMFILTAPQGNQQVAGYPGLDTQINGFVELQTASGSLWQGNTNLTGDNYTVPHPLTGIQAANLPAAASALAQYNGVVIWQDRRNSQDYYNQPNSSVCGTCTGDDGTVVGTVQGSPGFFQTTAAQYQANRVPVTGTLPTTPTFPSISINTANSSAKLMFNGVIYQPRGADINLDNGGGIFGSVQIFTGAMDMGSGAQITLSAVTNPLLKFVTAMIQ